MANESEREWLKRVAQDPTRSDCVNRLIRERTQAVREDARHEYDLVQVVRESSQDVLFSVRLHPRLPRFLFRVVYKTDSTTDSPPRRSQTKVIDRIEASREDKPGRTQVLRGLDEFWEISPFTPPVELGSRIYTNGLFRVDDVNFDGYLDVGILAGSGATGNASWKYWLYSPPTGRFETQDDLVFLSPAFDVKTKTIRTGGKCGARCFYGQDYKWSKGQLVLSDEKVYDEDY